MVVANTPISRKEAARMRHITQERFRQRVQFLRRQFLQDGDLPFSDVLTEEAISQALATVTGWLDRIFSPLVSVRASERIFNGDRASSRESRRPISHALGFASKTQSLSALLRLDVNQAYLGLRKPLEDQGKPVEAEAS
jgi:hypothetical protein